MSTGGMTSPFQWGPQGQRLSPQEIARRRALAESLAPTETPRDYWSGIRSAVGSIGSALHNWQADESERAGRAEFQELASALLSDPSGVGQAELAQLMMHDFASPQGSALASALFSDQLRRSDPLYQLNLERGNLELDALRNPWQAQPATPEQLAQWGIDATAGGSWVIGPDGLPQQVYAPADPLADAPAAFQTLDLRARAAGLEPGTPEYQQFMAEGGRTQQDPAALQRIGRLTENLMATGDFLDPLEAENIAVGIVDGRLKSDRHPLTGELQVVDMATGRVVYGGPNASAVVEEDPNATPAPSQFGEAYPAADQAFGLEGAVRGVANTIAGAFGQTLDPQVQQTQADFAVLRESLINDIASTYGRQPPSWLLRNIEDLTPQAGNPFLGPEQAQSKLRSIGRQLENERAVALNTLQNTQLSPTARQEIELRVQGIDSGLARVTTALQSFGSRAQSGEGVQPDAEGWLDLGGGIRMRELP